MIACWWGIASSPQKQQLHAVLKQQPTSERLRSSSMIALVGLISSVFLLLMYAAMLLSRSAWGRREAKWQEKVGEQARSFTCCCHVRRYASNCLTCTIFPVAQPHLRLHDALHVGGPAVLAGDEHAGGVDDALANHHLHNRINNKIDETQASAGRCLPAPAPHAADPARCSAATSACHRAVARLLQASTTLHQAAAKATQAGPTFSTLSPSRHKDKTLPSKILPIKTDITRALKRV